jgi:signal transduction histidine kinase
MVADRSEPKATAGELAHGIPMFLDQLIKTLRVAQPDLEDIGAATEIGKVATLHGRDMLKQGFTLEQVVRDYGDVCQAITNLAFDLSEPIEVDEFRTLNRCLDDAIAGAVTEYARRQGTLAAADGVQASNSRLGFLAHELRNFVHTATLAVGVIKAGNVGLTGATGAVLDRCLKGMSSLIDRSLAEVRVTADLPPRRQLISVADLLADAEVAASLESRARECGLTVSTVDRDVAVCGDRDMLSSALGNLLQNAFKFTQRQTEVQVRARVAQDRILLEVEDHCGGLAAGTVETMMLPFTQNGEDRSGVGLGLDISRRCVEANKGILSVRSLPGSGCIFTIDLPRHSLSA